jgi:hypothetical protein
MIPVQDQGGFAFLAVGAPKEVPLCCIANYDNFSAKNGVTLYPIYG